MKITFKKAALLLSFVILTLTACSKSVEITLAPEVSAYLSDKNKTKITLTSENEAYIALNTWLKENSDGWYSTSGRFPGGVYIRSGEHGIQVTKNRVVIYATNTEKPEAKFVQDLGTGELKIFQSLGKQ